jgi:hypothetical protein
MSTLAQVTTNHIKITTTTKTTEFSLPGHHPMHISCEEHLELTGASLSDNYGFVYNSKYFFKHDRYMGYSWTTHDNINTRGQLLTTFTKHIKIKIGKKITKR